MYVQFKVRFVCHLENSENNISTGLSECEGLATNQRGSNCRDLKNTVAHKYHGKSINLNQYILHN